LRARHRRSRGTPVGSGAGSNLAYGWSPDRPRPKLDSACPLAVDRQAIYRPRLCRWRRSQSVDRSHPCHLLVVEWQIEHMGGPSIHLVHTPLDHHSEDHCMVEPPSPSPIPPSLHPSFLAWTDIRWIYPRPLIHEPVANYIPAGSHSSEPLHAALTDLRPAGGARERRCACS
jgi:hypothetical protein